MWKDFKKTADDGSVATMAHPNGHSVKIVKSSLSGKLRKELEALPLHQSDPTDQIQRPGSDEDASKIQDSFNNALGGPKPTPTPTPKPQPVVQNFFNTNDYVKDAEAVAQSDAPKQAGQAIRQGVTKAQDVVADAAEPFYTAGKGFVQGLMGPDSPAPAQAPTAAPAPQAPTPAVAPQAAPGPDASGAIGAQAGADAGSPPPPSAEDQMFNQIPGYQEMQSGIAQEAAAKGQLGAESAHAYDQAAGAEQQALQAAQADLGKKTQDIDHMVGDMKSNMIKPNQYMENMSTPSKIATGIGVALGGFYSGNTGQANPGMQFLTEQIQRDLDAQKSNQSTRHNLLTAMQDQYKDRIVAENMFKAVRAAHIADQINAAGSRASSPMAQAAASTLSGQLKQQYLPYVIDAAWRSTIPGAPQGAIPGPGQQAPQGQPSAQQMSDMDPAMYVQHLIKNPEEQGKASKEIADAQNLVEGVPKALDAFDQAAKDNTVLRTGAGMLRTPGSVKRLEQEIMPFLSAKYGSARPGLIEKAKQDIYPAPGDAASTTAQKRLALTDLLGSKSSAPISAGHYIDLDRFKSTSTRHAVEQATRATVQDQHGRQFTIPVAQLPRLPQGFTRIK